MLISAGSPMVRRRSAAASFPKPTSTPDRLMFRVKPRNSREFIEVNKTRQLNRNGNRFPCRLSRLAVSSSLRIPAPSILSDDASLAAPCLFNSAHIDAGT